MKIFSGNSVPAKWIAPLVSLIVVGCFSLGLIAARFGASAPLARPAEKQTVLPIPVEPAMAQPATLPIPQRAPLAPSVPESVALQHDPVKPKEAASITVAAGRVPVTLPAIRMPNKIHEVLYLFGRSVQGRTLMAHVLGDGANTTMIFGDFHGNERSVPGVVDNLLQYLRQHPETWPNCHIVLIPYANPDGWAAGTRVNAHRIDINRNFPGTWKAAGRATRYNPGPRAGSEPETKAIEGLVNRYQPTKIVSIHQPLHMLNWTGIPGKKLAAVMHKANGYRISDDVGYATPGAFGDYCGKRRIAIVTMELPNEGISEAWAENREALLAAINAPI